MGGRTNEHANCVIIVITGISLVLLRRRQRLYTGLTEELQGRVHILSPNQLVAVFVGAGRLLADFYPKHIFPRLPQGQTGFWEHKHLEPEDWQG